MVSTWWTRAERGLFLANTFFQHKIIYRYTWRRRDESGEWKSMIDYIVVDDKWRKAVRGIFEGSDHYVLLAKIKIGR